MFRVICIDEVRIELGAFGTRLRLIRSEIPIALFIRSTCYITIPSMLHKRSSSAESQLTTLPATILKRPETRQTSMVLSLASNTTFLQHVDLSMNGINLHLAFSLHWKSG